MSIVISPIVFYIVSVILVGGVLLDMHYMSSPKTAVLGNKIGAASMLFAVVLTLLYYQIVSLELIAIALLLGSGIGVAVAVKVKMIHMPQTVALLHCGGAGAAVLVALASVLNGDVVTAFSRFTSILALVVGGLTFSGSLVAGGKLSGVMKGRPVIYPGHSAIFFTVAALMGVGCIGSIFLELSAIYLVVVLALALFFGYWFAIRIGGADMPITISLLNSFSGVAGGIAGMAISEPLLVAIGGVIGAAGLILTQIMCRAMNRHLWDILTGKTSAAPAKAPAPAPAAAPAAAAQPAQAATPQDNIKAVLDNAQSVIIVPGYGMALAQAQHQVKTITDKLEEQGKQVVFAIHPVAGRMPGHMNVLLAEANVDYEKLLEMDEINPRFAETDLVLVVGSNDVINPAAHTAEGTPIYGMPVLNVEAAKHIIICNYDTKPGYAGVENPLYTNPKATLLLGDAQDTLKGILDIITGAAKPAAGTASGADGQSAQIKGILDAAAKVIIVPGYGMALAQAQHQVKALSDKLEEQGKEVVYAIHPVAGRMPGHMNVLLAEAGVDYEKLLEMDEVNPRFAETDLVLVVGSNDVINPAAHTAEGTPIYGMPVLEVEAAKSIIICNYDTKPGYAGVENPLYNSEKAILLLGDAQTTVQDLLNIASGAAIASAGASAGGGGQNAQIKGILNTAANVIIVPGYGMALAQAQHQVKSLSDKLEEQGKNVVYAIHPVAGRMPGHMNVLLAEAGVDYEKLLEMDEVNPRFAETDLVLVVGSNDVINPAAHTAEGTPIYGMPVLNVEAAKNIIICNYDTKPGYAGVENPLYQNPKAILLLGDAQSTVQDLLNIASGAVEDTPAAAEGAPQADIKGIVDAAKSVIIVPGYGMALAQAQHQVKSFSDKLEERGKDVVYAIHPVAGRMPGHMNVLLAEAGVDYEKLLEMDEVNPRFAETDLVLVVGSNDVINPAAHTAVGTPIYGMPVLNVEAAKHIIICNFDTKPGYAGVENPLYNSEKAILLLGDAQATLQTLMKETGM